MLSLLRFVTPKLVVQAAVRAASSTIAREAVRGLIWFGVNNAGRIKAGARKIVRKCRKPKKTLSE